MMVAYSIRIPKVCDLVDYCVVVLSSHKYVTIIDWLIYSLAGEGHSWHWFTVRKLYPNDDIIITIKGKITNPRINVRWFLSLFLFVVFYLFSFFRLQRYRGHRRRCSRWKQHAYTNTHILNQISFGFGQREARVRGLARANIYLHVHALSLSVWLPLFYLYNSWFLPPQNFAPRWLTFDWLLRALFSITFAVSFYRRLICYILRWCVLSMVDCHRCGCRLCFAIIRHYFIATL